MKKAILIMSLLFLCTACSSNNEQETTKNNYTKIINNLNNQNYTVTITHKSTNKDGKTELLYDDYTATATVKVGEENDEYIVKYTSNLEDAEDKNLGSFLMKDKIGTKSEKCPFELTETKYSNIFKNDAAETWKEDKEAKTITFTKDGYEATLKYDDKELPVSFESTTKNEKTIVESYTFKYDKIDEETFVLNEDSKPSEEETEDVEEPVENVDNVPQNGSNQGYVAPNNNGGGSNSSTTSNETTSNEDTPKKRVCTPDNEYKYFYTDENGNFTSCPGTKDPVPEEKPNYVCEFGTIDKMKPCDYTLPEEVGPFGVFPTQAAAQADANSRGYKTGEYSNSFTFTNMRVQVFTYFPLK